MVKDVLGSVMQTAAISMAKGKHKTQLIEDKRERELKEEAVEKKSIRQAQDERKKKRRLS